VPLDAGVGRRSYRRDNPEAWLAVLVSGLPVHYHLLSPTHSSGEDNYGPFTALRGGSRSREGPEVLLLAAQVGTPRERMQETAWELFPN
jgi:hypothetical protein